MIERENPNNYNLEDEPSVVEVSTRELYGDVFAAQVTDWRHEQEVDSGTREPMIGSDAVLVSPKKRLPTFIPLDCPKAVPPMGNTTVPVLVGEERVDRLLVENDNDLEWWQR